jgi:hypothetical protein
MRRADRLRVLLEKELSDLIENFFIKESPRKLGDIMGTLLAFMAYSTWWILPSGEKVLTPIS